MRGVSRCHTAGSPVMMKWGATRGFAGAASTRRELCAGRALHHHDARSGSPVACVSRAWAAAEVNVEAVEELIKAGANFKVRLTSGFTPYLLAAREGHEGVIRTLLKAGDYDVRFDERAGELTILKNGKVKAKTSARVEARKMKARTTSVRTRAVGAVPDLIAVTFDGWSEDVVVTGSGSTSGSQ